MFKHREIVKTFSSDEYAKSRHDRSGRGSDSVMGPPFLEWGLAADGELCCRACFSIYNYPDWTPYELTALAISVSEMKKIIKEFGHLIVFA